MQKEGAKSDSKLKKVKDDGDPPMDANPTESEVEPPKTQDSEVTPAEKPTEGGEDDTKERVGPVKRGIEYHWQSLKKTKPTTIKQQTPLKYQNLVPTNKDVRVKLKQLQPGSPPVSQAIFNDDGELIGTRVFTKYDDGIGQKEAKRSPVYTSGLSPITSPFSREKRHSPEWDACASTSGDPDESKSPPSTSDHSHLPSSQGETESLPEHLHLDTTQESNGNEAIREEVTGGKTARKDEPKEVIFPATSGSPDEISALKEAAQMSSRTSDITPCKVPPSSPSKSSSSSGAKGCSKINFNVKHEVRHLEAIEDIMASKDKMSYSDLIAILDRCNLKHDVIDAGNDSFFVGVLKQMQINGVGTDVRSSNELRRMLGQHITYEHDYYKTVGDSFLSGKKMSNEDYALSVENAGTPIRPLDILATARFIDCSFRLIGALGEWTNDELVERIAHPSVLVTMIVYSPGEFYSTKPNLVRPSRRKTIAKLVEKAKEKGDSQEVGRVTLDILAAPTETVVPSTSFEATHDNDKASNTKPDAPKDVGRKKHERRHSSPSSDSDQEKRRKKKKIPSRQSKSLTSKANAPSGILRRLHENVTYANEPEPVCTPRKLRSADSSDSTNRSDVRSFTSPCPSRQQIKKPASPARKTSEPQRKKDSRSPMKKSESAKLKSSASAASKYPRTPKRLGTRSEAKRSDKPKSKEQQDIDNERSVPSGSRHSSTNTTATSSSDETDFSAINLKKLSPKDTTYFLGRTVSVIEKLRRRLSRERAKKNAAPTATVSSPAPQPTIPPSAGPASNRPATRATSTSGVSGPSVSKSSSSTSVSSGSCRGRSLFACRLCDRIFSSRSALAEHKRKDHPKRYSCTQCPKDYARQSGLSHHKLVHSNITFDCDKCSKKFSRKDRLQAHLRNHMGEYRYLCVTCGKGFERKDHYKGHMMRHLNIRAHQCPNCNKSFFYRHDQQHHTRNTCKSKDAIKVPCDICGKLYKTTKNMRKHRQKHTGFEKFVCPKCGKIFVSSYGFKLHIKRCKGLNAPK